MPDSIPEPDWIILFNRVTEKVRLGRTFNDREAFDKRFEKYIQRQKDRKIAVNENPELGQKWKDRANDIINEDLKNQKNLKHENPQGRSIRDRMWEEAQYDPDGFEGLTLRFGLKKAREINRERATAKLGPLNLPKLQLQQARESRESARRWAKTLQEYQKRNG